MFKCYECGELFNEPSSYEEKVGEYCGTPAYVTRCCCPNCRHDEYEEVHQCKICGEWFFDDELDDGICEDCIAEAKEEYYDNIKACLEILKDEKKKIEINPVLAMLLKPSVIESILTEYVLNNSLDCKIVVEEYEDWFIEEIKRGVQESE